MSKLTPNGPWGTDSVPTANPGTGFVQLPDHDCDEVVVTNNSGQTIDLMEVGSANAITLATGRELRLTVGATSQEITVRRTDQSNTPVTVGFIYRKFASRTGGH